MKKYYYVSNEGKQCGPISVSEFKEKGITEKTYVWCEGMTQWMKANDIDELKDFFRLSSIPPIPPVPPVFNQPQTIETSTQQEKPQKPENYLPWTIVATLLCCIPIGIVAIMYANRVDSTWNNGKYAEAEDFSKKAKMWLWIAVGTGAVSYMFLFIINIILGLISG